MKLTRHDRTGHSIDVIGFCRSTLTGLQELLGLSASSSGGSFLFFFGRSVNTLQGKFLP